MDAGIIENKWDLVNKVEISDFRFIRLSPDCSPELNIGYSSSLNRCLILELPLGFNLSLNSVAKENLLIKHYKENNYIVIELTNNSYFDLFNDLILSFYNKIKDVQSPEDYSRDFIYSFSKWAEFFDEQREKKLSNEQIQGLFGELFILKEYLINSCPTEINTLLNSWKGPFNAPNDFEFDQKHVEVKTKIDSSIFIKISSEFQLEKKSDKDLELKVVSVSKNLIEGKSVYDLLSIIVDYVRANLGELSIIYHALNQIGVTIQSLKQYNNHRYIVKKIESFDAGMQDFPKLSISNIASEIYNVKYNLRVSDLEDYIIEIKSY